MLKAFTDKVSHLSKYYYVYKELKHLSFFPLDHTPDLKREKEREKWIISQLLYCLTHKVQVVYIWELMFTSQIISLRFKI